MAAPRALNLIKYIFGGIGLCMLAGFAYWVSRIDAFIDTAARAQGTVIDLATHNSDGTTMYSPVVRFVSDEQQEIVYRSNTSSSPPAFSIGEQVEMLYDPNDPSNAEINSFFQLWLGPVIVGGLGLVFFLVGGGIALSSRLQEKRVKYLRENGMPIEAKFAGVERNLRFKVNGRHPYQLVAQWQNPAGGQVYVFKSENLWYDPTEFVKQDKLKVLVERGNPAKYWIDVSFLPPQAQ